MEYVLAIAVLAVIVVLIVRSQTARKARGDGNKFHSPPSPEVPADPTPGFQPPVETSSGLFRKDPDIEDR